MDLHHPLRAVAPPPGSRASAAGSGGDDGGAAQAVEVYHRTYTTILRSTGETRLRVLEASHRAMEASLHPLAASSLPDLGAFLYACRRLPDAIFATELVVLGQSVEVFARHGLPIDAAPGHLHPTAAAPAGHPLTGSAETPRRWSVVDAPGRRRRWFADSQGRLAVLMASASDVDDLIPTLVAFQIEWNKLHALLRGLPGPPRGATECAETVGGAPDDWQQLVELWGERFDERLATVAARRLSLRVRMLGGSQVGYARSTRQWWAPVLALLDREGLQGRPVHFTSSNSHSIVNLVTGTAQARAEQILGWVEQAGPRDLAHELQRLRSGRSAGNLDNLLYYAARLWFREHPHAEPARAAEEHSLGVFHVASATAIDVAVQVIALDRLDPTRLDPRLGPVVAERLAAAGGVVVNIDYPLGLAAYTIVREVAETVGDLRSVHILGKAATLNADVGDVMISDVVHDEHSGSTFFLDNAFTVDDIAPHLRFGSGLDHQRAVTVRGTFLQNRGHLDFYYREAFTVVEMEAGPFCQAVYELSTGERFPVGEAVNFSRLPVDLGIIHYASDTPFTQARTLGARGLSYHGMDSTYASSVAILRRVLAGEEVLATPPAAVPSGRPAASIP